MKTNLKSTLWCFAALMLSLTVMTGCDKSDDPVTVSGVSLDKIALTLGIGDSETIIATVMPDDAADKTVTWTSSAPAVVTVDNTGQVTALSVGNATITATSQSGGKTNTCSVTAAYAVGSYYPDAVNPVGIIFRVKTATQKGLVVSLTEAPGSVSWSNDKFKTSAIDENDGSLNMIAVQQYLTDNSKNWNELPPFNYVVTTMNGKTTYDAARDKWYLPSVNEWKEFAAVFSGKVYSDIGVWYQISPMPGYDDQSCVAARTAFNAKLTSKGGTQLDLSNDTGWYWSSTEHNAGDNVIYSFGFKNGSASADSKNLTGRVRAVLAF